MTNQAYRENFAKIEWKPLPPPEPKPQVRPARGDFPIPRVMRDGMDPVQSMTDGKMYDSKAALRKEYRRAGVIEVGNEVQKTAPPPRGQKDDGSIDRALSAVGL